VRLIDVLPLYVAQALERSAAQADASFEAEVGDARDLSRIEDENG
jgi:hypothetical protein